MKPQIKVYTDGAAIPNPGRGSYGFAIIENDTLIHEYSEVHENTTNNRMEMLAVLNSMLFLQQEAPGICALIHSDSTYVVNGINEWRHSWKKKNWKDVKNSDLWIKMDEAANDNPNIYFMWVRGHNGNKWNEYVDTMCSSAMKKSE